ncbi:MAG: ComEC/Rec2 family competence protein [Gemmataceae bacterium]
MGCVRPHRHRARARDFGPAFGRAGGFVWFVLRAAGVRQRRGAWIVMFVMIGYALLTGARPSAVRAAVMVCSLCGALVLRRPALPANAFALAWLVVIGLNPADPFTPGCQLSFLSVFVLVWGAGRWFAPRELTPLEALIESTRSPWEKLARRSLRFIVFLYGVSLVLGVANAPLILAWQNIASPAGIILGPPLILLTSLALVAGFLLLFASIIGSWLAWPFAFVVNNALAACAALVHEVQSWPGMWVFAPGPSVWWLIGFHLLLAGVVLFDARPRWKCAAGLFLWTAFGLLLSFESRSSDELRVTFLSVGHGGCAVIETPDGRVLLYDAGTSNGPDLVRRTVAPYLWSRGISRIDELFLSHADLDHFNGVPELLHRFPVGQVALTPSFAEKPSPGVAETIAALDRHGIPRRIAIAGDRFTAGEVGIEVLHPPAIGPEGNENARSLVLLLAHGERTFLLTGDLEGAGMEEALKRPIPAADVLLAPHHGAVNSNARREPDGRFSPGTMAAWAKPRFVVASQEPRETIHLRAAYSPGGATVWDTSTAGAVTFRSRGTTLVAEAYRTGEVAVIRR